MITRLLFSFVLLLFYSFSGAQPSNQTYTLPGKGLKQHPFLYVGGWGVRNPTAQSMFLVRDGKVIWQYICPAGTETH